MMLQGTRTYSAALACSVMALAGLAAAAAGSPKGDKGKPALTGVWVQKGGELKIEFGDKDVLKFFPHGDNDVVIIVCKYTIDKQKRLHAKITELEGREKAKAQEVVPVGLEFSFTWEVKNGSATLGDVKVK